MKKNLLLITIILFVGCMSVVKSYGQTEWAPIGAKWHYTLPFHDGYTKSFLTLESIGDTVIQGITCSILLQETGQAPYLNRKYYTYKNDDKVWLFDGTNFRLLYDFDVNPGDEWQLYAPSFSSCDSLTTVVVDSIGYEEINGVMFKYLYLSLTDDDWYITTCNYTNYKISEKFGSYGFLLPRQICALDLFYPCDLRCYEDNEFGFYSTGVADSCTYEFGVGIAKIETSENVKIFPNPVSDELTILLKEPPLNCQVWIYAPDGRVVINKELNSTTTKLNLSRFKAGNYLIKLFNNGKYSGGKIVKL